MEKKLISLDLETLDTATSTVILEIGITVGTLKGEVVEQFRMFPSVDEQLHEGRTVSGSTILWWFGQDSAAIASQGAAKRSPLVEVRRELATFLAKYDGSYVLGNAPGFDCDIIGDFLGGKPWKYSNERDVRTARMLVPQEARFDNKAKHNALADSEAQYYDFVTFLNSAQ